MSKFFINRTQKPNIQICLASMAHRPTAVSDIMVLLDKVALDLSNQHCNKYTGQVGATTRAAA